MTLGYSTIWPKRMGKLAGKPTNFQEKIIEGLLRDRSILIKKEEWEAYLMGTEVSDYEIGSLHPKLHTMRGDVLNRWKPYRMIHMAIRNRTKNRFQFAPTIPCVSTQDITIKHFIGYIIVEIDFLPFGEVFHHANGDIYEYTNDVLTIAKNDGFDNLEDFFRYFNTDFSGKIIHWTDLKY